jgi:hypothetical protein
MNDIQPLSLVFDQHCEPGPDGHCSICSDEGIPGRVIALRPNEMALVEMDNSQQEVALDLIENVQVGDRLLVHVGVAIARLEG